MHLNFRRCILLATIVMMCSLVSIAWAAGVGGTIESVDADGRSLVLKFGKDEQRTFTLAATTSITLDGKPALLTELKPGLKAFVTATEDRAEKIAARSGSTTSSPPKPTTPRPPAPARKPARPQPPSKAKAGDSSSESTTDPKTVTDHPWPQFGGPQRDNVSREKGLLKAWPPAGPKPLWVARGLGEGFSSVSVAGGKVLTMGNQGNQQAVLAIDLETGKPAWGTPCGQAFIESMGNGPRSVPTVDGDRVYGLGANGDLCCLDLASGRVEWQKNILAQFGGQVPQWGICESVLIDGAKLICTPGGRGATLVALDKKSGQPQWTTATPNGDGAAYASAIVIEVGKVRQYVQFTSRGTIGVRADDGRLMWEDVTSANDTANCSAPVFCDDCVFTASGYGTGGALLKLVSQGNMTSSALVYGTKNMKNQHGGMVVVDGFLYGANDPGILTCLELKTGKIAWENRAIGKCSLTVADGCLYVRSENGPMALVEANPREYRQLGRFDPPRGGQDPSWAYPVVAAGKLFLRDGDLLICYEVRAPQP